MRFEIIHNSQALSYENGAFHGVISAQFYHKSKYIYHCLLNLLLILRLNLVA